MIDAPEASLTQTSQAYFLEVISNATLTVIMSNAPNKQRSTNNHKEELHRNMGDQPKTAYITGGASGIGLALSTHLLFKNYKVFIADRNTAGATHLADQHNTPNNTVLYYATCDTSSWESQLSVFQAALKALGGRISSIQHFRRQDLVVWGDRGSEDSYLLRGTIGLVASVCGFYCVPSLPIYTAAKHALIGLTRSYGALLWEEGIAVNAVAPNVVRTGISAEEFYHSLEKESLLTPMDVLMEAFDVMLARAKSAVVYECGAKGWTVREGAEYLDEESGRCCDLLKERGRKLHYGLE
ncbi:NAD(P)-binding protein [Alternaria alternata]|uniref:NAD(P)-binding protein n=1 Tax=Alternaria alternata TaxID=5599 RepID=A0A177E358_ALTAL|nr:NAD(P)-binding protein [Alternaria alternata]OAG26136.1 NAD(P)-binding protein [Alternaria alternata]